MPLVAFCLRHFLADFIICSCEFDFPTGTGNGQRTFQCLDCEWPDPIKSKTMTGWLKGELGSAK